jgi:hypothetical protein
MSGHLFTSNAQNNKSVISTAQNTNNYVIGVAIPTQAAYNKNVII